MRGFPIRAKIASFHSANEAVLSFEVIMKDAERSVVGGREALLSVSCFRCIRVVPETFLHGPHVPVVLQGI
ncbi:hypothetical protein HBI56_043220 [Parastagonospora nodorum]|nr:hypothetical protein HBH53_009840 [Parastagonospora nodorum]KAH3986221.1 hypothetical protein HBH52_041030 [Parastagonospora nodorum]KAH3988545.1 hypothetical protein HBH51_007980 [Parastagonospora nodorum]KAH4005159.1 hypothetical protein HBI10_046510 [Parastagonospora nodorum]KAH4031189.1 hypothetical protein HBI13_029970 [Parastagonospora nodorum]